MNIQFPSDFLWGAATSAYQVEGGNIWSDWYLFELEGKVRNHELAGKAADHYHLFCQDFDMAKKMNHNCHRLSLEWSRIEKQKGVIDRAEIQHYKEVLQYLKENGFTTFVTLHHFTNPQWFEAEGGWTGTNAVKYFRRYVDVVIAELSNYIDFWITVNEPTLYIWHQYILGDRPPQRHSLKLAKIAFENYVDAHRWSYQHIHREVKNAKVGIANNFICYGIPTIPYIPVLNPFLNMMSQFWNFYYLKKIKGYQDFIGINFYTATRAMQLDFSKRKRADGEANKADMAGWKIYPEGMYYILMKVWHKYKKPMYITENGVPDHLDRVRKYYIAGNLNYINRAMEKGADVRGYMHWSLLDNFEWDYGFTPRFGLVEVDYKTMKRKPRPSAEFYSEICKTGKVCNNYHFRKII